jgi:hypothetical protein
MVNLSLMRWHLPSCDCIAVYNMDMDLPQAQRTPIFKRMDRKCGAHSVLQNEQDIFNNLFVENAQTSESHNIIVANAPASFIDINTNGTVTLKKNIVVTWSWTGVVPNRVLNIGISGISLTTNQKNVIQTKLDERFGITNVVIL